MTAAQYKRQNQDWAKYLGKTGVVLASTYIRVAAADLSSAAPYSYVLVDLGEDKKELMGAGHELLQIGDKVQCVLRKISVDGTAGLIEYGIKVQKI